MERERESGLERERGGYPCLHRGQPRRYSPSPEVRYYRGKGAKQGATKWGDRGEWSDVILRKGKA